MTDGNRTAVDVHFFRIDFERPSDGNGGDRESFVQFVEVDISISVPARLFQDDLDRVDRRHHDPLGLDTAHPLRDDARHRRLLQAQRMALGGD